MADAVISALVDQFVSHSLRKIEEEVRLVKNAKKDVEKLKKSLRLIQALLEDAGKKQLESASVRQWLSDLEETSYDMDNVLDEWNAAILKSEIEREAAGGSGHGAASDDHRIVVQKKVCSPMPSSCFCFKQRVKKVISLHDFAKKIKELNEELDRTKKDGNELGIVARVIEPSEHQKHAASSSNIPRITTSFVDETKIHGRDQDKAVLVSKLVCESSSDKGKGIEIIPIVGMGGLGKTTLAQIAYNDDRVKAHFDKRIWVCVSDPFDLIKIAKAIVEGLGENPQNFVELEASMQFISGSIRGKKFLLVLDDVWSKDKETWEQLNQPLRRGSLGSRILVTTRNKEVAMMMGVSTHQISALETLSDEQCWSIIKQLAFVEEEKELTQLEVVGRRIASKCKGLPLTAKFLGSLMCFKKSKRQWEDILHSELWESKAVDKIFAPFLLSYYDLSPIEKCCFSYCSVFPKDHVIHIEMLIEMWMSQGYFDESSKGRDCFESLAMRSFFQDFGMEEDGSDWSCKMHDIVHDFAQFLTKDKCVLVEGDAIREKMESLDGKAPLLTLVVETPSQFPSFKPDETNIGNKFRTLCVFPSRTTVEACGFDLLNLTCFRTLRTLHLKSNHGRAMALSKFPRNFPTMVHLRFLDLSYMFYLQELPESLCDLCNLQTLRLLSCVALQKLPTRIGKLINLKHLYILECFSLDGFPKGIQKLTRLQKLDAMVVPENRDAYFNVDDLKKLTGLQFQGSLTIKRCANFVNTSEAEKFMTLKNMEDLYTLNLIFRVPNPGDSSGGTEAEDAILEALRPHPNLKAMLIWYYKGLTISPSWIASLTNLRFLRILDCGCCKILPPLGKLPSLESLVISDMPSIEKVGLEFLGIDRRNDHEEGVATTTPLQSSSFVSFPRLEKLSFCQMRNWKEWDGIDEAVDSSVKVMPCLRSLSIEVCWSLKAFPDFLVLTPLQYLSIDTTRHHPSEVVKKRK